jgi:hypothetical protein
MDTSALDNDARRISLADLYQLALDQFGKDLHDIV